MNNIIHLEDIIHSESNPVTTLRRINTQIYPSKTRFDLNDKLFKYVFSLSDGGTTSLLEGETFSVVEKRDHRRFGDILTAYQILNAAGYTIQRPARLFDRVVLSACLSEQEFGNSYTTISILYRAITGKVGRSDSKPSKDQRAAIIDSIKLLMNRVITYDASDLSNKLNYRSDQSLRQTDFLLPAHYIEASVNGNEVSTLFFDRPSPLLAIARAKKQILTYDATLLDVPGQQNTFMNIELKNYAMGRVQEIIAHKLAPTLTLNDVFQKCRIENASNDVKMNARNALDKFFEHLQRQSVIKKFTFPKKRNAFHSIKFTY